MEQVQFPFGFPANNTLYQTSSVQNKRVGPKRTESASSLPPLKFEQSGLPRQALDRQPNYLDYGTMGSLGDKAVSAEQDQQFFKYLRNMAISQNDKRVQFAKMLSEKYGEEVMEDGKLLSEDPNPEKGRLEAEFSDDESYNLDTLKGERVDPELRISQVDKILTVCDTLTAVQRHSLVSRRNTAKLRLRQKQERQFQTLVRVDLNNIQREVSTCFPPS